MRALVILSLLGACNATIPAPTDFSAPIDLGIALDLEPFIPHCSDIVACAAGCAGHLSCSDICEINASAKSLTLYLAVLDCAASTCMNDSDAGSNSVVDGGALCASPNDTSAACQTCIQAGETSFACDTQVQMCSDDNTFSD